MTDLTKIKTDRKIQYHDNLIHIPSANRKENRANVNILIGIIVWNIGIVAIIAVLNGFEPFLILLMVVVIIVLIVCTYGIKTNTNGFEEIEISEEHLTIKKGINKYVIYKKEFDREYITDLDFKPEKRPLAFFMNTRKLYLLSGINGGNIQFRYKSGVYKLGNLISKEEALGIIKKMEQST